MAISASDLRCGSLDAARIRNIHEKRFDGTDVAELPRCASRFCYVSCCKEYDEVSLGQLPTDFKSDTPIGTRN